jgi:Tfp pilus assembly protein PilN
MPWPLLADNIYVVPENVGTALANSLGWGLGVGMPAMAATIAATWKWLWNERDSKLLESEQKCREAMQKEIDERKEQMAELKQEMQDAREQRRLLDERVVDVLERLAHMADEGPPTRPGRRG